MKNATMIILNISQYNNNKGLLITFLSYNFENNFSSLTRVFLGGSGRNGLK